MKGNSRVCASVPPTILVACSPSADCAVTVGRQLSLLLSKVGCKVVGFVVGFGVGFGVGSSEPTVTLRVACPAVESMESTVKPMGPFTVLSVYVCPTPS